MSYQNAIQTYKQIYRQADVSEIRALWASNRGDLNVYVHSPFCASICKFCYYKGVEFSFETDTDVYERYYTRYLPRAIEPFRALLESRPIGNYFFGGGTPSLMRPSTMQAVFGLFPGFQAVRSKAFEIHPAVWTEDQLDVLAENAFNCCIIGVQSFDAGVLERQRRIHAPFEKVQELVEAIRRRGMFVASDLIYRMDPIDADEIFQRDLALVAQLDCDAISLQLNYDEIQSPKHTERFFELMLGSELPGSHRWEGGERINPQLKKTKKCFRYVRNEIPLETFRDEYFPFIRSLDEASKLVGYEQRGPSVIGFGSYRNPRKNTFSNIVDEERLVEYIEVNNGWAPEYYVTYEDRERDFYDECMHELERLREIGPPPRGLKLVLENKVAARRENQIFRRPDSNVEVSVQWDAGTPTILEYVVRLKKLFPDWKWWND